MTCVVGCTPIAADPLARLEAWQLHLRAGVVGSVGDSGVLLRARLVSCDLAYVVVYVTAGMIVWPFVRPFYEHRAMPAMGTILCMQVPRGLVFVALLTWLVHELRGSRRLAILLGGLALSVFSAWDLLVPNPFMPGFARWAHLSEVGTSNLLFGAFVTWMLTTRAQSTASGAPADHASGARGVA